MDSHKESGRNETRVPLHRMPVPQKRELRASIADSSFEITQDETRRYLERTCAPVGESARTLRQVKRAINRLIDVATPDVLFRLHDVEHREQRIAVRGRVLGGLRLWQALRCCDTCVAYVLTLGPEVDRVLAEIKAKSASRWYIYDQVASRYAELICEVIRERMKTLLPEPWGVTERYSPGYCDWPLVQQRRVFDLLPPHPLGVKANRDGLMAPRKSVSGLMGVGPSLFTQIYGNACFECLRNDCPNRRTEAPF